MKSGSEIFPNCEQAQSVSIFVGKLYLKRQFAADFTVQIKTNCPNIPDTTDNLSTKTQKMLQNTAFFIKSPQCSQFVHTHKPHFCYYMCGDNPIKFDRYNFLFFSFFSSLFFKNIHAKAWIFLFLRIRSRNTAIIRADIASAYPILYREEDERWKTSSRNSSSKNSSNSSRVSSNSNSSRTSRDNRLSKAPAEFHRRELLAFFMRFGVAVGGAVAKRVPPKTAFGRVPPSVSERGAERAPQK